MTGNLKNDCEGFDKVIVCSDEKKVLEALSRQVKNERVLFLPVEKVTSVFHEIRNYSQKESF